MIDEARTDGAKVHFASLMDICHLKNAELEAKHEKYKGRVVLRGDIVNVKGMYPAPDIHEHFTIHKWLRQTAYIFTHNLNNLEHIANNCMSAMTHTDVTTAHH